MFLALQDQMKDLKDLDDRMVADIKNVMLTVATVEEGVEVEVMKAPRDREEGLESSRNKQQNE